VYLRDQRYRVAHNHALVARWRDLRLIRVDDGADPISNAAVKLTVARPVVSTELRIGLPAERTRIRVEQVDDTVDLDHITITVAPVAFTLSELRAMFDYALATIEVGE